MLLVNLDLFCSVQLMFTVNQENCMEINIMFEWSPRTATCRKSYSMEQNGIINEPFKNLTYAMEKCQQKNISINLITTSTPTQVHHTKGIGNDPYSVQLVSRDANQFVKCSGTYVYFRIKGKSKRRSC